ncbi:hypothetical protein LINGRAHAP2_LOCUS2134, partial [Linum grandiflorum]
SFPTTTALPPSSTLGTSPFPAPYRRSSKSNFAVPSRQMHARAVSSTLLGVSAVIPKNVTNGSDDDFETTTTAAHRERIMLRYLPLMMKI